MTWEFLIFIVRMFAASKLSFWNSFSHSQSVHSSKLKRLFHPYRLLLTPNALFMLCSALLMPSKNNFGIQAYSQQWLKNFTNFFASLLSLYPRSPIILRQNDVRGIHGAVWDSFSRVYRTDGDDMNETHY